MSEVEQQSLTTLASWLEWKEKCTIGRCSPATVSELANFGRLRLWAALSRRRGAWSLAEEYCNCETAPLRAWLTVERHLLAVRKSEVDAPDGKHYKDVMLEAVLDTEGNFQSYVTAVIQNSISRDLVREEDYSPRDSEGKVLLVNEEGDTGTAAHTGEPHDKEPSRKTPKAHRSMKVSIDAPLSVDGPLTLHDRLTVAAEKDEETEEKTPLTAEADEVNVETAAQVEPETEDDANEIRKLVTSERASQLWNRLGERQKMALWGSMWGWSTADMIRDGLFDCEKSQIYQALAKAKASIEEYDWGFPLNPRQRAFLTRPLLAFLRSVAMKWAETSEKRQELLFMVTGETI